MIISESGWLRSGLPLSKLLVITVMMTDDGMDNVEDVMPHVA